MIINSIETIKGGMSAKTGKPWTLVKITFQGSNGFHTGFIYDPVNVGQDVDVELYQEEYNGKMQNKFKIGGKKPTAVTPAIAPFEKERMMRMEALLTNINEHVMRIYKHLEIAEPAQKAGNTNVDYPEYKGEPNFEKKVEEALEDINPEDIPF